MVWGEIVESTAITEPGRAVESSPSGPVTRSRHCSSVWTHTSTTSQRAARSRADPAATAPRATSASTRSGTTSSTSGGSPVTSRRSPIDAPMNPNPTSPTVSVMAAVSQARRGVAGAGYGRAP